METANIPMEEYERLRNNNFAYNNLVAECKELVKSYRDHKEWHDMLGYILNIEEMIK